MMIKKIYNTMYQATVGRASRIIAVLWRILVQFHKITNIMDIDYPAKERGCKEKSIDHLPFLFFLCLSI